MKIKFTIHDYIKANRKGSRAAEIDEHGHAINRHIVHRSKKQYDRKNNKAGLKDLPFLLTLK